MGGTDIPTDDTQVTVSYLGGYIFLSYVISTMGCATTLELLHRRTAMAGLYNWYLLLTSSITMGGIGIWCMHFVGNRAIVLGDGARDLQILYSVTFTGVSFVLPVCVLLAAFFAIGVGEKAGYIRILLGGFLTGAAVCGMHYVGQLGIANYTCVYDVGHVVGSAIISVFASTAALGIFFRWRSTWTDSWWRRGLSACVLAGAVSGMHWTATTGTSYKDHDTSYGHGKQLDRTQTVIVCAVLACVSCLILLLCAIAAGGNRKRSSERAHQLVLSCAFFDPDGRIMVTPEAFLPTQKIVEHYIGRTFNDDDLTRSHPAFLWAFRASRNWKLIKDLVPFMKSRLESERAAIQQHVLSRGVKDTELQTDFDTLFKQLFCVAAQGLADDIKQPLQDLGILYHDILSTTVSTSNLSKVMGRAPKNHRKGQLLFTVRRLTKQEASRLSASGYRFASIEHVTDVLARHIHVPATGLNGHLNDMRDYAASSRNFEPGVHLVSYVMRPTIHDHFEILTAKGAGNPLPSVTLPTTKRLYMQHLEIIAHMDGWPILTCMNWLDSEQARAYHDADDFRRELLDAMSSLFATLPADVNSSTAFCPRPLLAPCRDSNLTDGQRCYLLAFCAFGTLDTQITRPNLTFKPLRLFRIQQQVNDGVFHNDVFSKELSQELFYSNIKSDTARNQESDTKSIRSAFRRWHGPKRSSAGLSTISQESLVDNSPSPFGEIRVQKEVKVDIAEFADTPTPAAAPSSASTESSKTAVAFEGDTSASTYVDELYNFCYSHAARMCAEMPLPHDPSLAEC